MKKQEKKISRGRPKKSVEARVPVRVVKTRAREIDRLFTEEHDEEVIAKALASGTIGSAELASDKKHAYWAIVIMGTFILLVLVMWLFSLKNNFARINDEARRIREDAQNKEVIENMQKTISDMEEELTVLRAKNQATTTIEAAQQEINKLLTGIVAETKSTTTALTATTSSPLASTTVAH